MTTFAHVETGRTVDVLAVPNIATYQQILGVHPEWLVVQVLDGTVDGATPDGQGGWTNPVPVPLSPPPQPVADPNIAAIMTTLANLQQQVAALATSVAQVQASVNKIPTTPAAQQLGT